VNNVGEVLYFQRRKKRGKFCVRNV